MGPMARKATQDDVAKAAGVTRSVVSYVLNGNARAVAPETREKILRAIEELGYRPNTHAQSLGTGRDNPLAERQIGIVLNDAKVFLRPYYAEILAGIHEQAHQAGYHIRFIRFFDELRDPLLFNRLIHEEVVCGIILLALDQSIKDEGDSSLIGQVRARVDNLVCVEWKFEGLSSVTFNRHDAAFRATKHLLSLGRRDVAYIGEDDERSHGFRQALFEAGMTDLSGAIIAFANDMASGYAQAAAALEAHPGIDAIHAGSDEVAIGILRYLHERRIKVPQQIALASIDDLEVSSYTSPPLTSVRVQKEYMGRQAVQLIIGQSQAEEWNPVTILLPSTLIPRGSSVPAEEG